MKRMTIFILTLTLLTACLLPGGALAADQKILVVTTIFPIYDWVREIVGENGDRVTLTMLLDSGVDLHSYQPTVQDIVQVASADVFIYVGGESDEWVEDVLDTANNPDGRVINLVEAMGEDIKIEELKEGMEETEHDEDEGEDHEEEEEVDEHVWLSLRNAEKLVQVIAYALAEADPEYAAVYQANAAAYIEKLAALDEKYKEAVNAAAYRTILFGDRFPFRYLADDYGLDYYAAFSGCSAEAEASFATIFFLAQKMDELNLPAVLTIEKPQFHIAETVVESTKAKNQKVMEMHSMQGVTAQDIADGATYLSLMETNLKVLKEALN